MIDRPFQVDHISEIHDDIPHADDLFQSQFTEATHELQHESYQDQRSYAKQQLSNWGLQMGELPYCEDNVNTLRCLLQMISCRQRDMQYRAKIKDDIANLQFEKDKYRSYMEQGQRALEENSKRLGRLENENTEIKAQSKRFQIQAKKQREEDKKMVNMLRTKNEKILHEIKKKDQEISRIKEQLRYNTGQRLSHAKNSFEVFEHLINQSPKKDSSKYAEQEKYTYLMERSQRELATAVKENNLLREKIYNIRDQLQKLNKWIDQQIFGERQESKPSCKFFINHNLLFRKESLVQELVDLVEVTKDGLLQLRQIYKSSIGPTANRMTKSTTQLINIQNGQQVNFKKKAPRGQAVKTDRASKKIFMEGAIDETRQQMTKVCPSRSNEVHSCENMTPNSIKNIPCTQTQFKNIHKQPHQRSSQAVVRVMNTLQHRPFTNCSQIPKFSTPIHSHKIEQQNSFQECELLQQIGSNDNSIISHISIENIGKSRFDKWDILYQDDGQ